MHLDVRDNLSFECDDKLLKLGSHISNFQIFKDDDAYIVGFIGEVEIYAGFEENASETWQFLTLNKKEDDRMKNRAGGWERERERERIWCWILINHYSVQRTPHTPEE